MAPSSDPRHGLPDVRVVLVTAPSAEVGLEMGRTLVREQRAACVNLVPGIRSVYRWEGALQEDEEVLLVIKTTADGLDALTRRVVEIHPYDVPEVLALPAQGGNPAYLRWVAEEVRR